MPNIWTIILSLISSLIVAIITIVVARSNNSFQRYSEELKVCREKAEIIISSLAKAADVYLHKYNYAFECRESGGKKDFDDKFGLGTEIYKLLDDLESNIHALTVIYFPSCINDLKKLQGKIGENDAMLRMVAGNRDIEHLRKPIDKTSQITLELHTKCHDLIKSILVEVEKVRFTHPYSIDEAVKSWFADRWNAMKRLIKTSKFDPPSLS